MVSVFPQAPSTPMDRVSLGGSLGGNAPLAQGASGHPHGTLSCLLSVGARRATRGRHHPSPYLPPQLRRSSASCPRGRTGGGCLGSHARRATTLLAAAHSSSSLTHSRPAPISRSTHQLQADLKRKAAQLDVAENAALLLRSEVEKLKASNAELQQVGAGCGPRRRLVGPACSRARTAACRPLPPTAAVPPCTDPLAHRPFTPTASRGCARTRRAAVRRPLS